MAKQVYVELVDDIDGSPIKSGRGETIAFAVDGVEYEIDLGGKNAKEFRRQLDYWSGRATRVGGKGKKPPVGGAAKKPATGRDRLQTKAIRDWANQNGFSVSERGRIPHEVEQAYNSAH